MSDDGDDQSVSRVSALLHAYCTTAEELSSERTTPERAQRLQDYLAMLDVELTGELERRNVPSP